MGETKCILVTGATGKVLDVNNRIASLTTLNYVAGRRAIVSIFDQVQGHL